MNRNQRVSFCITADEHLILTERADAVGLSVGQYVREFALTGKPPADTRSTRPVLSSVLHDPAFVKRLSDAQLRLLLTNTDPETVATAQAELTYRDEAHARLMAKHAVALPPDGSQRGRPERKASPYPRPSRTMQSIPRHLQVNNAAARQLARYVASLTLDELLARFTSHDAALADAAEREYQRRQLGIRLFHKPHRRGRAASAPSSTAS